VTHQYPVGACFVDSHQGYGCCVYQAEIILRGELKMITRESAWRPGAKNNDLLKGFILAISATSAVFTFERSRCLSRDFSGPRSPLATLHAPNGSLPPPGSFPRGVRLRGAAAGARSATKGGLSAIYHGAFRVCDRPSSRWSAVY